MTYVISELWYFVNNKIGKATLVATNNQKTESYKDRKLHPVVADNSKLVHRAIQLIRDPCENIVSRLHLERHRMEKEKDNEAPALYATQIHEKDSAAIVKTI